MPATQIPALDELAGDWMQVKTLRSLPSVNNFHGGLKTTGDISGIEFLAFPPLSQGGHSGSTFIDGKQILSQQSRWFPYQVMRRASQDGLTITSTKNTMKPTISILLSFTLSVVVASAEPGAAEVLDEPAAPSIQPPAKTAKSTSSPEGTTGTPDLHGAAGSVDRRYARDVLPEVEESRVWSAVAWRGERVHGQFLLWTKNGVEGVELAVTDLEGPNGKRIAAEQVTPYWVRYTLGAGQLLGDILEPARPLDVAVGSTRPVWLSVFVPGTAAPGRYTGKLTAKVRDASVAFEVNLEVLAAVLPPPADWSFHLDLWQNPWAVARYHKLEPWSDAHWARMKETLTFAADAGVKCLTTTILHRPWGECPYDAFGSMVKTIRKADGSYTYDFALFDRYVAFGMNCGINRQINCYSMVPWGNELHYHDDATGKPGKITAKPGSKEYNNYWRPFLKAFSNHLQAKGWLEKTTIAMDERELEDMRAIIALLDEVCPEMKITLAGNMLAGIIDRVHDYCLLINCPPNPVLNRRRSADGRQTTYYVACRPDKPNTFTFSDPAEATWLGWYAAANGYSGFLRWALCSYTENPLRNTDFGKWPTGDCFLIYPGPRSSIRFERLREGVQDYEKIRVLRAALEQRSPASPELAGELDAMLLTVAKKNYTEEVNRAKRQLTELTRKLFNETVNGTGERLR